jgi:hypothetical protein
LNNFGKIRSGTFRRMENIATHRVSFEVKQVNLPSLFNLYLRLDSVIRHTFKAHRAQRGDDGKKQEEMSNGWGDHKFE